jgi:hypothetical protein
MQPSQPTWRALNSVVRALYDATQQSGFCKFFSRHDHEMLLCNGESGFAVIAPDPLAATQT